MENYLKKDYDKDTLILTSPAFVEGGPIPDKYSGYGADVSPELHLTGISKAGVTMLITLDDLGHPIWPGFNHWVAWNLPVINIIPEGIPKGAWVDSPIHAEQGLAYGWHRYRGPKPPFNWNHEYLFTVYILDCKLNLSTKARKKEVLAAAKGHILQKAELRGKYQRKHHDGANDRR